MPRMIQDRVGIFNMIAGIILIGVALSIFLNDPRFKELLGILERIRIFGI